MLLICFFVHNLDLLDFLLESVDCAIDLLFFVHNLDLLDFLLESVDLFCERCRMSLL